MRPNNASRFSRKRLLRLVETQSLFQPPLLGKPKSKCLFALLEKVERTMAFRLNKSDEEILRSIAEHRVLTLEHLAVLHWRNPAALRRRLNGLKDNGLLQVTARGWGRHRGRPENLLSLSETAVDWLKSRGVVGAAVPHDRVTTSRLNCLNHQLLTNDFRVQLTHMRRLVPAFRIQFFSPISPFLPLSSRDKPLVRERIRTEDDGDWIEFIPDGVFATTHEQLRKTLLFFLEVDMGTETLTSRRRPKRDIQQKIVNYQVYFHLEQYKRYEKILKCQLRGFRLLILTDTPTRLAALCRLVREMPPSDFIWLTDREKMLSQGNWAAIWVRGGRQTGPLESLLGKKMPNPCPRLSDLT